MEYYIKTYSTLDDFENRNPFDHYNLDAEFITIDGAVDLAIKQLDVKSKNPIEVVKVESDDHEEIEVRIAISKNRFKLTWDGEALDIYIDNGADKDPTTITYWVSDEWLEDSESVTPAMITAMELFYTNPEELFNRLNLPYVLVD